MGYRHEVLTTKVRMDLFELRSCSFILSLIPAVILALLDSWYVYNLSSIVLHAAQSAKFYGFFVLCISYLCIEHLHISPQNIYENGPLVSFRFFCLVCEDFLLMFRFLLNAGEFRVVRDNRVNRNTDNKVKPASPQCTMSTNEKMVSNVPEKG
jgi:hypothetical protein